MKRTPLTDVHESLKAKMTDFGGFYMPLQYSSIIDEHNAVRNHAGIFDVSHMGEICVRGKEAEQYLNYILTNDVSTMQPGKILYSPICNEKGGCVDDVLIYKYAQDYFLVISNASNTEKDFHWMLMHSQKFNVVIADNSDKFGQIALQGPEAQSLLQPLTETDLSSIAFYTFLDNVVIDGCTTMISRTGYTGEDGFEIYTKPEDTEKLFLKFMQLGAKPCGLGARDTLRFESSLPLYGHELSEDISPLTAGLKSFVKLEKEDFIGRQALQQQVEQGLSVRLGALKMLDRGIPRSGYVLYNDKDEKIGSISSGGNCPSINENCAMAFLNADYIKSGQEIFVEIRNKKLKAVTVKRPFYKKKYKK